MALQDFSETQAMSRDQLRALLDGGGSDPTERVWAAWALALRGIEPGEVKQALASEPSSGVRRHLAVVLAGQGEREALATLAKSDPSVEVRAEATFRLAQVARPTDVPLYDLLCFLSGLPGAPQVREAVVRGIQDSAPGGLWACCTERLTDPEPVIRALTATRLQQAGRLYALPPERLRAYLALEKDLDQRQRLLAGAPGELLERLHLPPEPVARTAPASAVGALLLVPQRRPR